MSSMKHYRIKKPTIVTDKLKCIEQSIVDDLVERYNISINEAKTIINNTNARQLIRKHAFLIGHYPIEMATDAIWHRFHEQHKGFDE